MSWKDYISVAETYIVNNSWSSLVKDKILKEKGRKAVGSKINMIVQQECPNVEECSAILMRCGFKQEAAHDVSKKLLGLDVDDELLIKRVLMEFSRNKNKNVEKLNFLLYLFMSQGKFVFADALAKTILQELSKSKKYKIPLIWEIWRCYLTNDKEMAYKKHILLFKHYKTFENKSKVENFYKVLFCKKDNTINVLADAYGKQINNKRIAIIGPAKTNLEWEHICENNDIIVFITYKENGVYLLSDQSNQTRYISYYNNEAINSFTEADWRAVSRLDYICVKRMRKCKDFTRIRKSFTLDGMYFNGIPHMLQNILFDLVRFNPISIKVYGFNMYLSENQYRDNYAKNEKTNTQWLNDFALHNIGIQYLVLEAFYKNGYFEPDDYLKEILDLGVNKYLQKMEVIYNNCDKYY